MKLQSFCIAGNDQKKMKRKPTKLGESESESKVSQSCPTLCNPMDCSLPGSSAHGIFQARVLEWCAIAFSDSRQLMNIIFIVISF